MQLPPLPQPPPGLPSLPQLPPAQQVIAKAASEAGVPDEVIEGLSALATGMAVGGPAGAAVGLAVVVGKWLGDALFGGKSLAEATQEVIDLVSQPSNFTLKHKRDALLTYRRYLTSPFFKSSYGKLFHPNKSIAMIDAVLTTVAPAGFAADVPAIGRDKFEQMADQVLINFVNFQTTLLAPAVLAARPELRARAIENQIFLIQQILEERRLRGAGAAAGLELLPQVYHSPMRQPDEYFGARDAYRRGLVGAFEGSRHLWQELRPRYGYRREGEALGMRAIYLHGMDAAAEIVA